MSWPEKPRITWQEQVRTVCSIVTAVCLVCITVSIISAGIYTVHTISTIESSPTNIQSMLSNGKDVMNSAHLLLQSKRMDPIINDFHKLVDILKVLAQSIDNMQIQHIMSEVETWKNTSGITIKKIAKTILDL